ncbi:MAG: hypothetical protein GY830_10325 [Bacteroidetes bacterium]|nr:hypothetical protein [Bacteroidota bacterium]
MEEQNILLVLGAGASYSLISEQSRKEQAPRFTIGKFSDTPLGDELVKRIGKYSHKSISWIIAYFLYKLVDTPPYFKEINSNNISLNKHFFIFANQIENYVPKNLNFYLKDYSSYSSDDKKQTEKEININYFYNEFKKYFDSSILTKPCTQKIMIGNGKMFDDNIEKIIAKIFQNNDFIKTQFKNIEKIFNHLKEDMLYGFSEILFFILLEFLIANNETCRKFLCNENTNLLDIFFKNIFKFTKEICDYRSNIASNMHFKSSMIVNNNLTPSSIYLEFKQIKEDKQYKTIDQIINNFLEKNDDDNDNIDALIISFINELDQFSNKLKRCSNPNEIDLAAYDYISEKYFICEMLDLIPDKQNRHVKIGEHCFKKIEAFKKQLNELLKLSSIEEKHNKIVKCLEEYGFSLNNNSQILTKISNKILKYINAFMLANYSALTKYTPQDNIILEHLEKIYLSSNIVNFYQPFSIDYFMVNIELFAPYEFYDLHKEEKKTRKQEIYKYTKFIIADILMYAGTYTHFDKDQDNYIKHLIWKINEKAQFLGKTPEEFIKSNLKVITFNYENTFATALYDLLNKDLTDKILENIKGVYGNIYLEVFKNGNKEPNIIMLPENSMWNSLFLSKNVNAWLKLVDTTPHGSDFVLCENIFKQIEDRIKWIGEDKNLDEIKKQRESFQEYFKSSTEVYFLGFGFDINNLYRIGVIEKNSTISNNALSQNNASYRKIFVSGGNPKIITVLKDIFLCEKIEKITSKDNNLYILESKTYRQKIYVSYKYLPNALKEDF